MNTKVNIGELSTDEMEAVSGGGATPTLHTNTSISLPHIPQAKDLLTPQEIANMLSITGGFTPPFPHG